MNPKLQALYGLKFRIPSAIGVSRALAPAA